MHFKQRPRVGNSIPVLDSYLEEMKYERRTRRYLRWYRHARKAMGLSSNGAWQWADYVEFKLSERKR